MKIEIADSKGMKILSISGDIDMHTSPDLRRELMGLVHKKMTPILVDFGSVTYIDSSGIATFVEGLKGMMAYGGKLKLVGIPPKVMEIFCFAKLDRVFEIHGSEEDVCNR
ncbi:MAG: STAS domain-containing protein [Deltaproteobacteria bacterium]|nr:STAS domain-containing protein [Deltaproteobacteria bacterium]